MKLAILFALVSATAGAGGYGSGKIENGYGVIPGSGSSSSNYYSPYGYSSPSYYPYYPTFPSYPSHGHNHCDSRIIYYCWSVENNAFPNYVAPYWRSYCHRFLRKCLVPGKHETPKQKCQKIINLQIEEAKRVLRALNKRLSELKRELRRLEYRGRESDLPTIEAIKAQIILLNQQIERVEAGIAKSREDYKKCSNTVTPTVAPENPSCRQARRNVKIAEEKLDRLIEDIAQHYDHLYAVKRNYPHDRYRRKNAQKKIDEQNKKIEAAVKALANAKTVAAKECGEPINSNNYTEVFNK
uniref:Uncharacterized protein n=1 Tax=Rhabditophanes sp. KR3021 TaxID=114890 RepID=A0AC35UEG2_9BILA